MIEAREHIAHMAPYALAKMGAAGSISLAENESTFGPSRSLISAGLSAASAAHLYPDPEWSDLREAIAEVQGLAADGILCGAGSMELIGALIRALCGPNDEVIGSEYGYLFVATACAQTRAKYTRTPEANFCVSVEAILDRITPATKIVFVCNPGNPTGTRISNPDLCHLRTKLPDRVLLIVDQAYAEFDDQDHRPIFDLVDGSRTVVTRTFSKAYGLAGARVGWGYFPARIASEVRKLLNPNNISTISQAMAAAAMQDQGRMRQVVAETALRRDALSHRLRQAGYAIPESHTNFVLIQFASPKKAELADRDLRSKGLILRAMRGYGLPHCLRATIGEQPAMDRVADILISLKDATS